LVVQCVRAGGDVHTSGDARCWRVERHHVDGSSRQRRVSWSHQHRHGLQRQRPKPIEQYDGVACDGPPADGSFTLGIEDTPLTGDWNGDGRTKIGVYNQGFWFLDYDGSYTWDGGIADKIASWGLGSTPMPGRW
jgi:hypothetical protein